MEYLQSQGKEVIKIRMNSKIFEDMTDKLDEVENVNGVITVFGIPIEADKHTEKYAYILEDARPLN